MTNMMPLSFTEDSIAFYEGMLEVVQAQLHRVRMRGAADTMQFTEEQERSIKRTLLKLKEETGL